ncbi:MAG TPA: hypothetical protein DEP87_01060 [Candidatus Pacebacteria bacterium]|nr:hypothetical protein [Candidatus Paceibacterota bacterium]
MFSKTILNGKKRDIIALLPISPTHMPTNKYNLYRIGKDNEGDLVAKLVSSGLTPQNTITANDWTLVFYLSESPSPVDIWWMDQYSDFINESGRYKNTSYFGVLIISNQKLCYAVSLGKSHFYLKDFCDNDFGINLAERIADENNLKLKNSKLYGGQKNKTITSYQNNSDIEFDSGESIHYIKAKSIEKAKWGETVSFGNSAQFHVEIPPIQLPSLIVSIETVLLEPAKIKIPRSVVITDKSLIKQLDEKLILALSEDSSTSIQVQETALSGIDFIFVDKNTFKIYIRGVGLKKVTKELTIKDLKDFVSENNIDLNSDLEKIKVRASNDSESGFTKPLKYFLDYVDEEDNYFLMDGIWHEFNQNYIEFLKTQVDEKITFESQPEKNFTQAELDIWSQQQTTAGNLISYSILKTECQILVDWMSDSFCS